MEFGRWCNQEDVYDENGLPKDASRNVIPATVRNGDDVVPMQRMAVKAVEEGQLATQSPIQLLLKSE